MFALCFIPFTLLAIQIRMSEKSRRCFMNGSRNGNKIHDGFGLDLLRANDESKC